MNEINQLHDDRIQIILSLIQWLLSIEFQISRRWNGTLKTQCSTWKKSSWSSAGRWRAVSDRTKFPSANVFRDGNVPVNGTRSPESLLVTIDSFWRGRPMDWWKRWLSEVVLAFRANTSVQPALDYPPLLRCMSQVNSLIFCYFYYLFCLLFDWFLFVLYWFWF